MADTSSIPQTVSDTLSKVLGTLGDKFGATGSHLWEVYVQYVFAHGVVDTVLDTLMIIICVITLFKVNKIYSWLKNNCVKSQYEYLTPNPAPAIAGFIIVAACIIFGVISFIGLSNDMVSIISPEGFALSQIIGQLK